MYRIDNSSAVPSLPAPTAPGPQPGSHFTDQGASRTILEAEWLNAVQEEIANVVTNQGALDPILNKAQHNQLLMGIRREVNAAGGGGATQPTLTYLTAGVHFDHSVAAPSLAITPVCSIALTAGNWLVWGHAGFNMFINNVQLVQLSGCITVGQNTTWVSGDTGLAGSFYWQSTIEMPLTEFPVGCAIIRPAAATTLYLLARPEYGGGTTQVGVYGFLAARAV